MEAIFTGRNLCGWGVSAKSFGFSGSWVLLKSIFPEKKVLQMINFKQTFEKKI